MDSCRLWDEGYGLVLASSRRLYGWIYGLKDGSATFMHFYCRRPSSLPSQPQGERRRKAKGYQQGGAFRAPPPCLMAIPSPSGFWKHGMLEASVITLALIVGCILGSLWLSYASSASGLSTQFRLAQVALSQGGAFRARHLALASIDSYPFFASSNRWTSTYCVLR